MPDVVQYWTERLNRVPSSILRDQVDAETLAQRYDVVDQGRIDELTRAAGRRARPDDRVGIIHFDQAAESLGIAVCTEAERVVRTDGGHEKVSLEERVEALEEQLGNLEARVEHVDGKVNRLLTGARSFTDALQGGGGERDR